MTPEREQALRTLVEVWLSHRPVNEWHRTASTEIAIRRAEVILPGRPGLLDLVAEVNGRLAHLVVGLRRVGDEPHFLRAGDEMALGLLEDDDGSGRVHRRAARRPAGTADAGHHPGGRAASGAGGLVRDDEQATVLDCGDRGDLWVFPWLGERPAARRRPPAGPRRRRASTTWRRRWCAGPGRGGIWGSSRSPWPTARGVGPWRMTSLRDLYALGGRPEAAGGDFGPEAHALGTMTARMHLALDRAFDRQPEPVSDWVDAAESVDRRGRPRVARGARDGRSDQVAAGRRSPAARHPHPRGLSAAPHVAYRSGLGGERLPARWRAPRRRWCRPRARPWPTWPTCCGRCTRRAWRPRSSGTRPGAWTWPRSGRPGRRAIAAPCSTAT